MKDGEHLFQTLTINNEPWRIVYRAFYGYRILHGEYVEWPVKRPYTGELVFADYSFNGERSMERPNLQVPAEVRAAIQRLLQK